MLAVHPFRELLRTLPLLAGIVVAGSSTGQGGFWSLIGVGVMVVVGLLRWFTTSYRITADQVQVRRGIVQRRVVGVPLDRVRTVDITASALHRVLGLVRITIGTGLSDRKKDDDLRLDGLSASDAARLHDELLHREAPTSATSLPQEEELARLDPSWVRYGPFTLSGLVSVALVAGFVWRIADEAHFDPTRSAAVHGGLAELGHLAVGVVVAGFLLACLVAASAASTVGYVLAFWGFRLSRQAGGALHVTRGLISTRATTIEERRLRGVEISEPLLLRAARGARCIAIATGLRVGRGAERGGSLLLPPAPREEAQRVAALVLGAPEAVTTPLVAHGPHAQRRRFTRTLLPCAAVILLLMLLWRLAGLPPWTWMVSVALLPLGAALAADRYRSLGHAVVGRSLVTRWGSLVRRRCVLASDGIIGWNVDQSFFQRRLGLATLVATTAAGRQQYRVQDVSLAEALHVAEEGIPGLVTPFLLPAFTSRGASVELGRPHGPA
jgi:putative membrane protein